MGNKMSFKGKRICRGRCRRGRKRLRLQGQQLTERMQQAEAVGCRMGLQPRFTVASMHARPMALVHMGFLMNSRSTSCSHSPTAGYRSPHAAHALSCMQPPCLLTERFDIKDPPLERAGAAARSMAAVAPGWGRAAG